MLMTKVAGLVQDHACGPHYCLLRFLFVLVLYAVVRVVLQWANAQRSFYMLVDFKAVDAQTLADSECKNEISYRYICHICRNPAILYSQNDTSRV